MYKKHRALALLLVCIITLSFLNSNHMTVLSASPSQEEIQQKLNQLATLQRPYLVIPEEDVQQHLYNITQRDFNFVGEPDRTKIDIDYLNTVKNSEFGPLYCYFTGLDMEEENNDFWNFYDYCKTNRATIENAEKYKGAEMRSIWRWLIGYHFVQDFEYATDEQKNDLFNYTTELVDMLYEAQGQSSEVPEELQPLVDAAMGGDFSNYRNHNYHAEVVGVLFYYALVFPEAPNAAKYFNYAMEEFEYLMDTAVYDGGAWNESPRYGGAILRTWVPLFHDIKRLLGYDLFQNEGFKSMLDYYVEAQTPASLEKEMNLSDSKKSYYQGRSPAMGDSVWTTDWYMFCAMAAPAYVDSDPELAGKLMYAWKEAGSPFVSHRRKEAISIANINPDITPIAPDSNSFVLSEEKGNVIFKSDIDGENEKWLLFRCGKDSLTDMPLSAHQHADKNSFSLFAYGYPIAIDPGMPEYDADDVAFYRSRYSHNTVDFAKFVKPHSIYSMIWGEEKMQFTTTKGYIEKFESNESYDLVVGRVAKKGWENLIETQTYNYYRSIFFAKPDYFIIRDDIQNNEEATYQLNALSEKNIEFDGYETTFDHPEEDIMLKTIFLNHSGLSFESSTAPLAQVPEWGNEQKALKATHSTPEQDGFISLLYPYREGDPEIYTSYDDELHEIQVIKGRQQDIITFNDSEQSWNIISSILPDDFVIGRLYTEQTLSGGPHGTSYDDYNILHRMYVDGDILSPNQIKIRSGARVDAIEFSYANGTSSKHGGDGGTEQIITLDNGVFIKRITAYNGEKDGHTRVFGLKIHYTDGTESPVYGTQTNDITELGDPEGRGYIVGMHGRSGAELDRLGVIIFIPEEE